MTREISLIPTAGALGNEVRKRSGKAKKEKKEKKESKRVSKKKLKILKALEPATPNAAFVAPVFDEAPLAAKENLAGRPDALLRSDQGVKRIQMKIVTPNQSGNLNTESYLQFRIHSNKNEWIRFRPDALSLTLFGQWQHPNYDAASQNVRTRTQYHAMLARTSTPRIAMDPSVMGSGFIQRVEVSINNNPVPTNSAIGNLFLQLVRCNNVYNHKAAPYFATTSDFSFDAEPLAKPVMQAATAPFDYNTWNAQTGVRIPVYSYGIFPLCSKLPMMEALESKKQENLYFPPDTIVELKFHLHRTRMEAIFHSEMNMTKYFNKADAVDNLPSMKFTFQDSYLEYESVELHPANHVKVMEDFHHKGIAYYPYDITRGQVQSLQSGTSFAENNFQIQPWARFVIVMFLKDWAAMVMEATKRPLSGFSQFPANASSIEIGFAGEQQLVMSSFENFGVAGRQHEVAMKMYWQYVKSMRLTNAEFDKWFPKLATEKSLIQSFLIDTHNLMSKKTENLSVRCRFSGNNQSPADTQVCVISIHPNGQAVCKSGPNNLSWTWEFLQQL